MARAGACAVVAAALAAPASASAQGPASVSGTVTADNGATPLPGVTVTAESPGGGTQIARDGARIKPLGDPSRLLSGGSVALPTPTRSAVADTATTDAGGAYTLDGLILGESYVIRFEPPQPPPESAGYASEFWDDEYSMEDADRLPLTTATTTGIDADLEAGGAISGTVTAAENSAPLANVCVKAVPTTAGLVRETRTDTSGDYTLSRLRAGDYKVHFDPCDSGLNRVAEWHDGAHDESDAEIHPVVAGPPKTGVDATLDEIPVDAEAPTVEITSGPADGEQTADSTPTFTFTANEESTFECGVDAAAPADFVSCGGGINGSFTVASPLSAGQHSFTVIATDLAGNESVPATHDFTVDTTPPAFSITSGPDGPTNNASPSFGFDLGTEAQNPQCSVDRGTPDFRSCTGASNHTAGPLADGGWTFRLRAEDALGNTDTRTRSFTVDTHGPVTTISYGPDGETPQRRPTFVFAADEQASFRCAFDGAALAPCSGGTSHAPATELATGPHTFTVVGTDAVGNAGQPATRSFTVDPTAPPPPPPPEGDSVAPVVRIVSGPGRKTKDRTPTLGFNADEQGVQFTCWIDAKPAAPCESPTTLKRLKKGKHTFNVTGVDTAGNQSATATHEFKVKKKKKKGRKKKRR